MSNNPYKNFLLLYNTIQKYVHIYIIFFRDCKLDVMFIYKRCYLL